MTKRTIRNGCLTLIFCSIGWPSTCLAQDEWEFKLAPYVWATALDQEINANLLPAPIKSESSFSDLLESLDGALLVAFKAQKGRWAVSSDLAYMSLSLESPANSDVETTSLFWDALGRYEVVPDSLEITGGLRFIDVDIDVNTSNPVVPDLRLNKDYLDYIVGAKYTLDLSSKWELSFSGDVSLGGDTDSMWMGQIMLGRRFSDNKTLLFGYRRVEIDLKSDGFAGRIDTDIIMDGIGVGFRFEY
ncbi:MAG: hypothetical protein ACR2PZ_09250 [Pseudomonadales bacterium]